MGAFICQISEKDWELSKLIGLYGNRENKPDYSGKLRLTDEMSVVRDLISIKPGDLVFFHVVKTSDGMSRIHGIYEATTEAFYDANPVWNDKEEAFPFRFCFRPHPDFSELTSKDVYILVSDLYKLIESRRIWSIATLENERNIERRAVRKILIEDAQEIVKLFVKHPKFRERAAIQRRFYEIPFCMNSLEEKLTGIGKVENSIKAFLLSELKKNSFFINNFFGEVIDYTNETFVAQTTRRLFDLLVISGKGSVGRHFFIVEAKTLDFSKANLSQLLGYVDLFKLKHIFDASRDKVTGCALAKRFSSDLIEVVSLFKYFGVVEDLRLLSYKPECAGKRADFIEVEIPLPRLSRQVSFVEDIKNFGGVDIYREDKFLIEEKKISSEFVLSKIYFKSDESSTYGFLKDCLTFEGKLLSCEKLKYIFKVFNQYVTVNRGNDYLDCSLLLKFKEAEETSWRVVQLYNTLFDRPPIMLRAD